MSKSLRFLIFVAAAVLATLIVATFAKPGPLDTLDGCPISGLARGVGKIEDNELKNRYAMPADGNFSAGATLDTLLRAVGPSDLDNRRAVRVTGYVREVKSGGVESCNCRSTEEKDQDTHIELVPEAGGPLKDVVITEVTPRSRFLAAKRGLDWSTEALRRDLVGKRVEIEGWLYFDPDHIEEAFTGDPDDSLGRPNWRGTSWEVHPVMGVRVLR